MRAPARPPLTRYRAVFREHCGQGACRVDREAGVIYGVKVIGTESANGVDGMPGIRRRVYPLDVLRRAAPLYEGALVDWNHPGTGRGPRDASDGVGVLRRVRVGEGGLFADLHYLKSHARAGTLAEAAERMPRRYGLSPYHSLEGTRQGDAFVVSAIREVHSVDIVHSPATTRGLFEAKSTMPDPKKPTYEQDDDALGMDAGAAPPPAPEAPAAPAPGEGYKMEAMALLDAIFSGDAEALKKLNELARLAQKHLGAAESGGGDAEEQDEDEDDKDSKKKKEGRERPRFNTAGAALKLLAEAKVAPTPLVVKALEACGSETEMKEVISDYKQQSKAGGPRSAERGARGRGGEQVPDNPADFAKWIQN